MKRFVCLFLALIMVVGILPATALAASERSTSENAVNLLTQFEGFEAKEYTSGGKSYIGYGTQITPGSYPNGITESKAREIMKTYLKDTVDVALNNFTATNNLDLTQNEHDALAIFSYSYGTAWLKGNGPLRAAVLQGKTGNAFINALAQSHGGTPDQDSQYFKGMMNRRLAEANLYLNGKYSYLAPENYTYVIFDMNGDERVEANDLVRAYDAKTYPLVTEKPTVPQGKDFLGWYLQDAIPSGLLHWGTPVTYLSSATAEKVLVARFSDAAENNPTHYTINTNTLPYLEVFDDDMFEDEDLLGQWIESIFGEMDAPYSKDEFLYQLKMEFLVKGNLKKNTDFLVTRETQVSGAKWLFGYGTDEDGDEISGWVYYGGLPQELPSADNAIATATTTAVVNIREGATAGSEDIGDIAKGQTVKIYEIKVEQTETGNKNWGKVSVNGVVGWINLAYAEIDAVEDGDNLGTIGTIGTIVGTDYVNVRSSAGIKTNNMITRLPRGTKVLVVDTKTVNGAQWGKVMWEGLIGGYTEGWVYMHYVQLSGSLNGSTGSDSSTSNEPVLYTGVVTSNINLNVRKKADVYSDKVGSLPNGTKINIYEVKTKDNMKWGRIGEDKWVCLAYVSLTEVESNTGSTGSTTTTTSIQATVTSNTLDVYLNYNSNSEKLGTLKKGDVVTILERNTETTETGSRIWGRISKDGLAGWINLAYVELKTVTSVGGSTSSTTGNTTGSTTGTATAEGFVYNCITLNVRESAGVGSDIVVKLPANTRVTVYEQITYENAPWARIKWNNGANEGWACMYYISLTTTGGTTGSTGTTTGGTSNVIGGTNSNTISATGTVNSNIDLNVRAGAGLGYGKIGTLKNGTNVTIYEQVTADGLIWGRINYGTGTGWVCMSYINVNSASSTGKGVMGTIARCFSHVNVRSAPGTNNALVGTINVGTRVEVFEQQLYSNQYWGRVAQGWICMDYVLLDSELPPGTILDATQPTTEATQATQATEATNGSTDVTVNTSNEVTYVITGTTLEELNVRNDASASSIKVGTINANRDVTIRAVKNSNAQLWGRIDEYATAGWINMDYVSYSVTGYVNTDDQPVYVNPDTDSAEKGTLNLNTKLTITKLNTDNEIVYGWVESGLNGWIPMARISDKEVETIPTYKSSTDSFGADRTSGTTTAAVSAYDAVNGTKVVFNLKSGVKVYVGDLKIENGVVWGKLTANGTIGWINMSAVNYVISGGSVATELNVRTAKNTTDPNNILDTLAAGASVNVCELGFDAYGNLWGKVTQNANAELNGGYIMIRNTSGAYNVTGIF